MSAAIEQTETGMEIMVNHDSTAVRRRRMGGLFWALPIVCLAVVAVALAASPAQAAFGIKTFTGGTFNSDGSPATQAGSHPHEGSVDLELNSTDVDVFPAFPGFQFRRVPDGDPRDVSVDLPLGFVANPNAVPKCDEKVMQDVEIDLQCPAATQVGIMKLGVSGSAPAFSPGETPWRRWVAVYNMDPPRGVAAQLGFNLAGVATHINGRLRDDGTYGITAEVKGTSQTDGVYGSEVFLWGTPYDSSHDGVRDMSASGCLSESGPKGTLCPADGAIRGLGARPFLTNPMDCSVERIRTSVRADSWQEPGVWHSAFFDTDVNGDPLRVDGCDELAFDPSFTARPDSSGADSPSGLSFELRFPQDGLLSPSGRGTAHLKRASVTLPEGMTINPSAAGGLAACSDEQLGYKTPRESACPEESKIGSVVAESPLLDEQIHGGVYVGTQRSDDPRSGEMFRLFIVLKSEERGLDIKLPGSVRVDPQTGRIVTTFDDNPQLPVSRIALRIKSGERAPLALPTDCGAKQVKAEFTSWSGHVVEQTDSFTVACPGADGFAPAFEAGSVDPTGAAFSPFVARIERDERQQFLSGVTVHLPEGLAAKLRGVQLCPDAVASDGTPGTCPTGSRIGTATVGAGSGRPFYLQAPVYLTGPYNGAPYGLAVHVHAKAGPFDFGTVKVRQALHVDRTTARVSAVSDPLPQIVKGVPVRLRSVDVDVDRADFTINPTSCDEKRVAATFTSIDGAVHSTASRFQAGDCQALPFKPRLGLRLTGKRQRTTGRHPGVRAVVRQTGIGEAGIEKARVTLPRSLALDPDNAQALCEYEDGIKPDLENHCPKGSIVGRARAKTPLLDRDLVGDVYFVKNVRRDPETGNEIRTLPMIVVALRGEIAINLYGRSSTARNGRLVNTFAEVPDAPITRFNLNIKGGSNGILAVTRTRRARIDLCTNPRGHIATNRMNGHNGKQADYRVRVKTPCGKAAKAKAGKKGEGGAGEGSGRR